jgi:hypothetical protein
MFLSVFMQIIRNSTNQLGKFNKNKKKLGVFLAIEHGNFYAELVITQETPSIPVVYYITMKTQLSVVIFPMKS